METEEVEIATQYNPKAQVYSKIFKSYNNSSIDSFYSHLLENYKDTKVLDLGCGDGADMLELLKRSARVSGVDSSKEMTELAIANVSNGDIRNESFATTSFQDSQFDWVVTKWALQTHPDIEEVQKEVVRVLKPNGVFLFLVTHPLRQFMEQRQYRDYFSNRLVTSRLFDNKVVVEEPNHSIAEYLNEYFCNHFQILALEEGIDEGAEVIDGEVYPSFLLVKARKISN